MRQPKYPIYIISKGRAESRLTSKALERSGTNYRIVIEPQEFADYSAVIDPAKILVLPFSNLGLGSIPARNWVWEHSIAEGHERHWILDDNIDGFIRFHENTKIRCNSAAPFIAVEEFTDRFDNIAMSGMDYDFMHNASKKWAPYYLNTKVYSDILIKNDLPVRWRVLEHNGAPAPYNEDTDLSLQCLKAGYCTVLTIAFLAKKAATHTMKGGNTEEVYKVGSNDFDNRRKFAEALHAAHPDHVEVVERWGRWHHFVGYEKFYATNALKPKPNLRVDPAPNELGLKLVRVDPATGKPLRFAKINEIRNVYNESMKQTETEQ